MEVCRCRSFYGSPVVSLTARVLTCRILFTEWICLNRDVRFGLAKMINCRLFSRLDYKKMRHPYWRPGPGGSGQMMVSCLELRWSL